MQLDEHRNFWTQVLGAPSPQWMIVMALQRLDRSDGASVQAIAETLQVNPTFVTSQTRFLESKGLIRLQAPGDDFGAVSLSLTEKSRQRLAELALLQQKS